MTTDLTFKALLFVVTCGLRDVRRINGHKAHKEPRRTQGLVINDSSVIFFIIEK
jgi:hypothetical protein